MDNATQEQIGELMYCQTVFAEAHLAWRKAASAKKWNKNMETTRQDAIDVAELVVDRAKEFGMNPEIVCYQAVNFLKATSQWRL